MLLITQVAIAVSIQIILAQVEIDHIQDTPIPQELSLPGSEGLNYGPPISDDERKRSQRLRASQLSPDEFELQMEKMKKGMEMEGGRGGRSVFNEIYGRWPNGIVPYQIEDAFTDDDRLIIASGMANIEENTCIRFVPMDANSLAWVNIYTTGVSGCYANPRYYGYGEHEIGLETPGCVNKGIVVHELLHILGVAHEQQRPDRDQYVTMHWDNIPVENAYNMWRDVGETEDLSTLKICSNTGVTQATANFSDCVSGTVVTDFGIGYDFKSVMHYGLKSFAVDSTRNVMTPKNSSITEADVGNIELSPMDIDKLNRAYFCNGTTKSECGGNLYSKTGGTFSGNTVSDVHKCEFIFSTDGFMGIELNIVAGFKGTCSTDYLEIRIGDSKSGVLLGIYCQDNPIPASIKNGGNKVWMRWVKTTSTMSGTWTTYEAVCDCNKMKIENLSTSLDRYWERNTTALYGGKPFYQYDNYFLNWNIAFELWVITDVITANYAYAYNKILNCPQDLTYGWFVAGSGWIFSPLATTSCSDCSLYANYTECDVCCDKLLVSSSNATTIAELGGMIGEWELYEATPEFNGKPVYYKLDMCMHAQTNGDWKVGLCADLTALGGYAFARDNAQCADQTGNAWLLVINGTQVADPTFKTSCVVPTTTTTPTTTTQAVQTNSSCVPCKTVLEGPLLGLYTLKAGNESRCADSCAYEKDGKSYCFEQGGYTVEYTCG